MAFSGEENSEAGVGTVGVDTRRVTVATDDPMFLLLLEAIEGIEAVPAEGVATEAKQDDIIALIGEATESPAANTLLARVKALSDALPLPAGASTENTLAAVQEAVEAIQQAVEGTLTVTGGGGGTEYTEDVAAPVPAVGTAQMMIRDDALAGITPEEGDWTPMFADAYGALWVSVRNAISATLSGNLPDTASGDLAAIRSALGGSIAVTGTFWQATQPVSLASVPSHDVTNAGVFAVQAASAGDAAHDAADSGNPVKVGGRARTSERSAVANDDRVDFVADVTGKQIVLPYANPENFVSGAITTAMTGTTDTSLLAAPGSGLRNYITTIIVSNAHATVGTDVVLKDGSGGTVLMTIPAAAIYGGAVITLPTPLRQPTANTALYAANLTTGASTKVSVVGYKGA